MSDIKPDMTMVSLDADEQDLANNQSHSPVAVGVPVSLLPRLKVRRVPTQEDTNEYQSAGVLMRHLADTIVQWREQLPEDQEPAILAILNGGMRIQVERLAQESFHGIRIEGFMNGAPCMLLAHQSTVQLLCFIQPVEASQQPQRRKIGFIIEGEEQEV